MRKTDCLRDILNTLKQYYQTDGKMRIRKNIKSKKFINIHIKYEVKIQINGEVIRFIQKEIYQNYKKKCIASRQLEYAKIKL